MFFPYLILLLWFLLLLLYLYQETTGVVVERLKVSTGFHLSQGVRCVQISDLHFRKLGRVEKQVIKRIKEINPQLLFLTGDYLAGSAGKEGLAAFLQAFPPGMKIYAVRGNHDYTFPHLKEFFSQQGVTLLSNQGVSLEIQGLPLNILGVESIDRTYSGVFENLSPGPQEGAFNMVLAHTYSVVAAGKGWGIQLYLVGDTHGGQIYLPWVGKPLLDALFGMEYLQGAYPVGSATLYVNRGLGWVFLPLRLGSRPEITLLELQ